MKFLIVFNSMIYKYLTLFCLIKIKFLLNRLNLFFGRMNLISNFAARKGHNDSVAQLVEHYTFNVVVLGSNPSGITEDSIKTT
jgi:hypothetical protein